MVMCFVADCKHYSEPKTCKFLSFPVNPKERKKWITLIRRADREPSKYSLVCSCHFQDGKRKNRPTIFKRNIKKRFLFTSPERRTRNNKKKIPGTVVPNINFEFVNVQEPGSPPDIPQEPLPGSSAKQEPMLEIFKEETENLTQAEIFFLPSEPGSPPNIPQEPFPGSSVKQEPILEIFKEETENVTQAEMFFLPSEPGSPPNIPQEPLPGSSAKQEPMLEIFKEETENVTQAEIFFLEEDVQR